MTLSLGGQLARALSVTGSLVAGVRDEQWSSPTPCTDWTVRDLVNHLVGANLVFAALLQDRTRLIEAPTTSVRTRPARTAIPGRRCWLRSTGGVFERTFPVPIGSVPGAVMLHLRITDLLVHAWDLAQATSQPAELPDDLVEQALAFSRILLADVPRAGRFG